MKRLLILVIVLAAGTAWAQPFLVCDSQSGVTSYTLTGPSWVPTTVPAQTDGSIRMDVAAAVVGSNALTVKACKVDPVWGTQCSAAANFTFTRPGAPSPIGNIRLSP